MSSEVPKQDGSGAAEDMRSWYMMTLAHGLHVLEVLGAGPCTTAEIRDRTGLERSRLYRLLKTLEVHGFIKRRNQDGKYQIGLRVWEIGTAAPREIEVNEVAGEVVKRLASELGESVHLGVYDVGEVVYIDKANGSNPILSYTRLGGRAPSYCVATGKMLLASQSPAEIERVLKTGLKRFTPHTITDSEQLVAELTKARAQGIAVNVGEWREGVAGVAVPVHGSDGSVVAALGFSGPADRLLSAIEELTAPLRAGAEAISRELGYRPRTGRTP